MDLHSLYGNMKNSKDSKVMRKEIMKEGFKEKSSDFFSRKSSFNRESDSDKSNNVYS